MLTEKISLREDNENVYLTTYIQEDSEEIMIGKRPAIIICPGGAYLGTSDREAEPVAMHYLERGYQAFVLRYTTTATGVDRVYPDCLHDLANTICLVRSQAQEWHIDSHKVAVVGFSAGAHLTAALSVHWHEDWLGDVLQVENEMLKPDAAILGYPFVDYEVLREQEKSHMEKEFGENGNTIKELYKMMSKALTGKDDPSSKLRHEFSPINYVSEQTPPTFLWHTAADQLVSAENSLKYAQALSRHGVDYELHIFENGPHGLSLAAEVTAGIPEHVNKPAARWIELADNWLQNSFRREFE